ncbi:MAG: hypothetical protein QF598_00770 [Arenicellales bacterium]|jgi:hypothetical protein|nr:hypothetical protein [Arenicellales bacterium]MDP6948156.1 hypothetical protein [Arenicellales bacterium]
MGKPLILRGLPGYVQSLFGLMALLQPSAASVLRDFAVQPTRQRFRQLLPKQLPESTVYLINEEPRRC